VIQPIRIIHQAFGRFDRRHSVGPAVWPHFDILWLHRGSIALEIAGTGVLVNAPGGVLIAPNTSFCGQATTELAVASICHFEAEGRLPAPYLVSDSVSAPAIQAMLDLLVRYEVQKNPWPSQALLLSAILDAFQAQMQDPELPVALARGWAIAAEGLDRIRSLYDVADAVDMSESGFRALHRSHFNTSAGQHLLGMRMDSAAKRLTTSGDKVADVAHAVGYASPESFSQSFRRYFGTSPRVYRKSAARFA